MTIEQAERYYDVLLEELGPGESVDIVQTVPPRGCHDGMDFLLILESSIDEILVPYAYVFRELETVERWLTASRSAQEWPPV